MEIIVNNVQLLKSDRLCKTHVSDPKQFLKNIRRSINMYLEQVTALQNAIQSKEKKLIKLLSEEKQLLSELKGR